MVKILFFLVPNTQVEIFSFCDKTGRSWIIYQGENNHIFLSGYPQ